MDNLKLEFIRQWATAPYADKERPTLEAFTEEFPAARTAEFIEWWSEFVSRQARRERKAAALAVLEGAEPTPPAPPARER